MVAGACRFAVARHHPGGALAILRQTARVLRQDPAVTTRQLLQNSDSRNQLDDRTIRVLTMFFTGNGLALPGVPVVLAENGADLPE
jgi:hypothetical protein